MPTREQSSLVFQEFEDRLEKALEVRFTHSFQFLSNNFLFCVGHSTTTTSFG